MIKTILLNYGFCALTGGVLELLLPQKSRKSMKIVIAVVLIFSVLVPVLGENIIPDEIDFSFEDTEKAQYEALLHTANLTERRITSEIKELLISIGIDEYEIYVSTSVEENTVYLDEICIEVDSRYKDKTEEIYKLVNDEYKTVLRVENDRDT